MNAWDRLLVAPLAPMNADGELNLDVIERLASILLARGAEGFYLCGSTGEGVLLTVDERKALVGKWVEVVGDGVPIVVHVGDTCIRNACALAEHAGRAGVAAISAMGPMYPGVPVKDIDDLLRWSATIAASAPHMPFFHYHMGAVAGLPRVRMADYVLRAVERIPSFVGVKFTHEDLMDFGRCLGLADGRFVVLFGRDEMMLPAMVSGAKGFVGGSFNLTSPLARQIISAYHEGDLESAQRYQRLLQEVIALVQRYGGMPALKSAIGLLGIDLGPLRQPWRGIDPIQAASLVEELEKVWPQARQPRTVCDKEPRRSAAAAPTLTVSSDLDAGRMKGSSRRQAAIDPLTM